MPTTLTLTLAVERCEGPLLRFRDTASIPEDVARHVKELLPVLEATAKRKLNMADAILILASTHIATTGELP